MSKDTGLEDRYQVIKRTNPNKQIDCIVLEFDDPIGRQAIRYWAELMQIRGYEKVCADTMEKVRKYGDTRVFSATSSDPVVFFFGCTHGTGHGCTIPGGKSLSYYKRPDPFGPSLDSGYAPADSKQIEFRCKLTQKNGWTIIAFWDRTVDHRGQSNAAFVAEGLHTFDSIMELAEAKFPELFRKRFKDKLTLAEVVSE